MGSSNDLMAGGGRIIVADMVGERRPPHYSPPHTPRWMARLPYRLQQLLLAHRTRQAKLRHAWQVAHWHATGRPEQIMRMVIPRGYITPGGITEGKTVSGAQEYSFTVNMMPTNPDIMKDIFG